MAVIVPKYQQTETEKISLPVPEVARKTGGEYIGAGLQNLGQAAYEIGERVQVAVAQKADTIFTEFVSDALYNPDTGYFYTEGEEAVNNREAILASINGQMTSLLEGMDAGSRLRARSALENRAINVTEQVNKFAVAQQEALEKAAAAARAAATARSAKAALRNAAENVTIDPSSADAEIAAMVTAWEEAGKSPEDTKVAIGEIARDAAWAAKTAGNYLLANDLLEKYGRPIAYSGPEKYNSLKAEIDKGMVTYEATAAFESIMSTGRNTPLGNVDSWDFDPQTMIVGEDTTLPISRTVMPRAQGVVMSAPQPIQMSVPNIPVEPVIMQKNGPHDRLFSAYKTYKDSRAWENNASGEDAPVWADSGIPVVSDTLVEFVFEGTPMSGVDPGIARWFPEHLQQHNMVIPDPRYPTVAAPAPGSTAPLAPPTPYQFAQMRVEALQITDPAVRKQTLQMLDDWYTQYTIMFDAQRNQAKLQAQTEIDEWVKAGAAPEDNPMEAIKERYRDIFDAQDIQFLYSYETTVKNRSRVETDNPTYLKLYTTMSRAKAGDADALEELRKMDLLQFQRLLSDADYKALGQMQQDILSNNLPPSELGLDNLITTANRVLPGGNDEKTTALKEVVHVALIKWANGFIETHGRAPTDEEIYQQTRVLKTNVKANIRMGPDKKIPAASVDFYGESLTTDDDIPEADFFEALENGDLYLGLPNREGTEQMLAVPAEVGKETRARVRAELGREDPRAVLYALILRYR